MAHGVSLCPTTKRQAARGRRVRVGSSADASPGGGAPSSSRVPAGSGRSSTPRPGRHPRREGGVHLRRGGVDEAGRAQDLEDLGNLGIAELVGRRRTGPTHRHAGATAPAVGRRPGSPRRHTGAGRPEQGLDHREALVDHGCCLVSSSSLSAASRAKSSDAFPWASKALRCRSRRPRGARSSSSPSRARVRHPSASCGAWRPAPRSPPCPGPGATRRCGSSTGLPGAAVHPSRPSRSDPRTPPGWRACTGR